MYTCLKVWGKRVCLSIESNHKFEPAVGFEGCSVVCTGVKVDC